MHRGRALMLLATAGVRNRNVCIALPHGLSLFGRWSAQRPIGVPATRHSAEVI